MGSLTTETVLGKLTVFETTVKGKFDTRLVLGNTVVDYGTIEATSLESAFNKELMEINLPDTWTRK